MPGSPARFIVIFMLLLFIFMLPLDDGGPIPPSNMGELGGRDGCMVARLYDFSLAFEDLPLQKCDIQIELALVDCRPLDITGRRQRHPCPSLSLSSRGTLFLQATTTNQIAEICSLITCLIPIMLRDLRESGVSCIVL